MRINSIKKLIFDILFASLGLFCFGFGVYLTINANLGAAPWDAFSIGLSSTVGIKYGTASIIISFSILAIDIILKEPVGWGMILDALIIGKTVDLFNWLDFVPSSDNKIYSFFMLVVGMTIMGSSQFLYMKAALGCGPRDTLLVALTKRLKRIPIGIVQIIILSVVTFIGWILNGPIGIGTLLCAVMIGPIMGTVFRILKFDATAVKHRNFVETIRSLQ